MVAVAPPGSGARYSAPGADSGAYSDIDGSPGLFEGDKSPAPENITASFGIPRRHRVDRSPPRRLIQSSAAVPARRQRRNDLSSTRASRQAAKRRAAPRRKPRVGNGKTDQAP